MGRNKQRRRRGNTARPKRNAVSLATRTFSSWWDINGPTYFLAAGTSYLFDDRPVEKLYGEVLVHKVTMTYIPDSADTVEGLYAMSINDIGGHTAEFTAVATSLNAKIRRTSQPCTVVWRPTSPVDRNWVPLDNKHSFFYLHIAAKAITGVTPAILTKLRGIVKVSVLADFRDSHQLLKSHAPIQADLRTTSVDIDARVAALERTLAEFTILQ